MRVQHNIPAMSSYRNYNNNTRSINKNLEKLSSGYKINRAGDDAAGLAISEKMRAQITGLDGAQKNAKDGISLVQTAEGALTEVHSMLNRMYSLAEQSANGTYDASTDRAQLQKEVNQLRTEIDRIADSANFNGIKLLNGQMGGREDNYADATKLSPNAISSVSISGGGTEDPSTYPATDLSGNTAFKASFTDNGDGTIGVTLKNTTLVKGLQFYAVNSSDGLNGAANASDMGANRESWATIDGYSGGSVTFRISKVDDDSIPADASYKDLEYYDGMEITVNIGARRTNADGSTSYDSPDAIDFGVGESKGQLKLQIGDTAESYDQLEVTIGDVHVSSLGISGISIAEQSRAGEAMAAIKAAINMVSDVRGTLGATQNRLEHTINNLSVMQENIQDAESTIRDTDVADEMMKYTKNSILVQSAQAMLAQANQQPQGVLQLLQ